MEKSQEFFYKYGKELIERIKKLTVSEIESSSNSLYVKDGIINKSGDEQVGFDDFLNKNVLDYVYEWKDVFPVVLVSEETGVEIIGKNPEYFMILDPLDGSNNVRPWFTPEPIISVSLAIGALKNLKAAGDHNAVDFSMQKEIFRGGYYYSTKEGAFYEGYEGYIEKKKLNPSPLQKINNECTMGIDLDKQSYIPVDLLNFITREIIVRRLGTSIMDLCQVASGQYDAYLSLGNRLKITDVCQPLHLLRQAGAYAKIKTYLNGQSCQDICDNYLRLLLEEENYEILNDLRFNLVVAGTYQLGEDIIRKISL